MIISKKNLLATGVSKADNDIPALATVHVREDGTTIACNGKACLLVSPVRKKVLSILRSIFGKQVMLNTAVSLKEETVKEVIKNIPQDKKFNEMLEHCSIEENGSGRITITMTNGIMKRSIEGKVYDREYINYRVFTKAMKEKKGERVILNLTRFLLLLQTIDKIIKTGDEDNPVFIEFGAGGSVIIRGLDKVTGQRVVGIMYQYVIEEQEWLAESEWEKSLLPKRRKR